MVQHCEGPMWGNKEQQDTSKYGIRITRYSKLKIFQYLKLSSGAVAAEWIDDAFADNATLLDWKCSNPLIQWYTLCNKICHKLGANIQFRNSIPKNLKTETPITSFIQQLMSKSSEWRAMKLVVLGHGRIGKTTLLSVLHSVVDPHRKVRLFFGLQFPCWRC